MSKPILRLKRIKKNKLGPIDLVIHYGDIISLLGRGRSGKTTLLKIIAGLESGYEGNVEFGDLKNNIPISWMPRGESLFPWLNVFQNVILGLNTLKIPVEEKIFRTHYIINRIGLSGFEYQLPEELSTGMYRKTAIARALAPGVGIVLLDEPFSELDSLTRDSLREDMLDICEDNKEQAIVIATNNIEDAVFFSKKSWVLKDIGNQLDIQIIDLNINKTPGGKEITAKFDEIYQLMTSESRSSRLQKISMPDVDVSEVIGLLIAMSDLKPEGGYIDLPKLGEYVDINIDSLLPIIDLMNVLNLVNVFQGDIQMTNVGKVILESESAGKKSLLSKLIVMYVPISKIIINLLQSKVNKSTTLEDLEKELKDMGNTNPQEDLKIFLRWAIYTEILGMDADRESIFLL